MAYRYMQKCIIFAVNLIIWVYLLGGVSIICNLIAALIDAVRH